ncbi:MAG: GNAT family N-acetyltransferase, partial [Gammaproteobacteria bacterium]|nr:GNAT family N-acetyltransferase [Gammaproteobacteria bacterium]
TANLKMDTMTTENLKIRKVVAPLSTDLAQNAEAFLVSIFEYGDYSFRSALRGDYSQTLDSTFFIALQGEDIVGVAGNLCSNDDPLVSILSPVAVASQWRRNGLGRRLVDCVLDFVQAGGGMAVYLAVSSDHAAVSLYRKSGFEKYFGIVMRRLFCSSDHFEKDYFGRVDDVRVRSAVWGDYAKIMLLLCFPCSMKTFDLQRGFYSSKYSEPKRFLSVFPEMMRNSSQFGNIINVLAGGSQECIAGIARMRTSAATPREHIAELCFFVHDDFINHADNLIRQTLADSRSLKLEKIVCHCPGTDTVKRDILAQCGARHVATLTGHLKFNQEYDDVLVYELTREV